MAQTAVEPITASERRCLIVSTKDQLDALKEQLTKKGYPGQRFESHGSNFYTIINEELTSTVRKSLKSYCCAILPG